MSAGRYSAQAAIHAVALVLALAAAPLAAQTTIGLRVGLGSASLSGDDAAARGGQAFDEPRGGIVAGVDAGIPLSGGLGVRLGMGLAQKGGAVEVPPSITASRLLAESTAEFEYVQFSALLRAGTTGEGGNLSFGLLAGPYVAFNLSCQVAVSSVDPGPLRPEVPPGIPNRVSAGGTAGAGRTASAQDTEVACGEGGVSAVKSTDFGLAVGGGFQVRLSASMDLAFEVIYSRGLSEIDDEGTKTGHVAFQGGLVFAIG
ncbi:outer membrane beta-barrel protein [Candidatus Palauibacter sp.]|uniref:outer membrane beta-barrel protein n=1 Tax=Candidatus Palauibacter sp. TaxID=3101350 RepID=UPI003B022CF4